MAAALRVQLKILFLCSICWFGGAFRNKDSYPTIHDVISFKTRQQNTLPTKTKSELTIDIEKLDIQRIKKDDTAFRNQLMGGFGGELLLIKRNVTRRNMRPLTNDNTEIDYLNAYVIQFRVKMADNMLQIIYMARSHLRKFISLGYFQQESEPYRASALIHKAENLFFKAKRYFITLNEKLQNYYWPLESFTGLISLHHKVVMNHHDFMRLFMILMEFYHRGKAFRGDSIHSTLSTPKN